MKQKDILLIAAVVVIAGILSVVVSKVVFVTPDNRQQQVEDVEAISTNFTIPSKTYFNADSVNPTQTIQIGNSTNPAPFKENQ